LNTPNTRPHAYAQQRRSQRILLSVSVLVTGQNAKSSPFSVRTQTQVVNAHGALIQLREPVVMGQKIKIKNLVTNEEAGCNVVDINPGSAEIPEVGVAFTKPSPSFWRVSFPPEDWNPRNPEAKRVSGITLTGKPVIAKK
jgi:hypothetical protein